MEPAGEERLGEEIEAYKEQRDRQVGWLTRRFGCFGNLLGWLAVIVALALIYTVLDALSAPWAYTFFGLRPTLVGQWVGAFTTPGGSRGLVYLNLQHPYLQPGPSAGDFRWIKGSAASCLGGQSMQTYEVYGRANPSGSDLPLEITPTAPFNIGYSIQSLRGSWSGSELTLSGILNHIVDQSGSTTYDPNDVNQSRPVTIVFRKGAQADFASACAGLGP